MFSILLVTMPRGNFFVKELQKDNSKFTVTFYKYFTLYTELLLKLIQCQLSLSGFPIVFDYTS